MVKSPLAKISSGKKFDKKPAKKTDKKADKKTEKSMLKTLPTEAYNTEENFLPEAEEKKKVPLYKSQSMKGAIFVQEENEEIEDIKLEFDEAPPIDLIESEGVKVEEKPVGKFIIRHNSKFRMRWDLFIIILVIYNCILIPMELAFQEKTETEASEALGYLVDLCFVTDIIINFRTTFINEKTGLEILDGKSLAISYIKQWRFWFDLLSIIPFELLYQAISSDSSSSSFKIFDLMKLIRLLRLSRIITYLKFRSGVKVGFRLVYLLFGLLVLVHWVGCMWYAIIIDSKTWMPPKDTNYNFTTFYTDGLGEQYSVVFYYAILLLVGNEVDPMETNQTLFASMIVILGQITTAFIFGNMASLMANLNQADAVFQEEFDHICNLMKAIQLPGEVQEEVEAYLLHIQQFPDMKEGMKTFLSILSPSLRSEILMHMFQKFIEKISVFQSCTAIELRYIVNLVKSVIFLPDDEIIRQGESGDKLYFITRGSVQVWIGSDANYDPVFKLKRRITKEFKPSLQQEEQLPDNLAIRKVRKLNEGNYFGEIALITNMKRTTTITTLDFTTLTFLTKKHFKGSRIEYPQIFQNFKNAIRFRYDDENFRFRKKMMFNVPYFKNLPETIILELVYLLKSTRYEASEIVIKKGDKTNTIQFLKSGLIDVEIPLKKDTMKFDTLNPGSCFCLFSAFDENRRQSFDFKTRTLCVIETLAAEDLSKLQKEQLQLSDELRSLRVMIETRKKAEFDYFRYVPTSKDEPAFDEEKRANTRKKIKMAVAKFFRRLKKSQPLMYLQESSKNKKKSELARRILYDQVLNQKHIDDSDDETVMKQQKEDKIIDYIDQLKKQKKTQYQKLSFQATSNKILQLVGLKKQPQPVVAQNPYEERESIEVEERKSNLLLEQSKGYFSGDGSKDSEEEEQIEQSMILLNDHNPTQYLIKPPQPNNFKDDLLKWNNDNNKSRGGSISTSPNVNDQYRRSATEYSYKTSSNAPDEHHNPKPTLKMRDQRYSNTDGINPIMDKLSPPNSNNLIIQSNFDRKSTSHSAMYQGNSQDLLLAVNRLTLSIESHQKTVTELKYDINSKMHYLNGKVNYAMKLDKEIKNQFHQIIMSQVDKGPPKDTSNNQIRIQDTFAEKIQKLEMENKKQVPKLDLAQIQKLEQNIQKKRSSPIAAKGGYNPMLNFLKEEEKDLQFKKKERKSNERYSSTAQQQAKEMMRGTQTSGKSIAPSKQKLKLQGADNKKVNISIMWGAAPINTQQEDNDSNSGDSNKNPLNSNYMRKGANSKEKHQQKSKKLDKNGKQI